MQRSLSLDAGALECEAPPDCCSVKDCYETAITSVQIVGPGRSPEYVRMCGPHAHVAREGGVPVAGPPPFTWVGSRASTSKRKRKKSMP